MHESQQHIFTHVCIAQQACQNCLKFVASCIAVNEYLLREELLVAAVFGDSHRQGAVTGAPQLRLGGQQVGALQGVGLQPLLQLLLHIAHIPPVAPAPRQTHSKQVS